MKTPTTAPDPDPAFLTIPQTYGKMNIGKTLFFSLRSRGIFGVKPVRIGRKVLYPAAEIERYILAVGAAKRYITASEWQTRGNK